MGLNTNSGGGGGNMIFLNPINTKEDGSEVMWARRVAAGVDGATERDAKCGLVHELYYPSVTGYIQSVRIVDKGQFGEDIEVALKDNEDGSNMVFILQSGFSGDIGRAFIYRMQNIDPNEIIEIGVCVIEDKRYCFASQAGNKIENAWKKENPDGNTLPQPIKTEGRGGKVAWDWSENEDALFAVARDIAIDNGWAKDNAEFGESFYKQHKDDAPGCLPSKPEPEYDDDEPDDEPF